MNLQKILLVAVIPLLLNGCGTLKDIKNANIGNEFTQNAKGYRNLVRWQEFESAISTYVSGPLQEEYRKKVREMGEVKVVDYRVKKEECDPVGRAANVVVELDYYRPPSVTVKTVTDNQKWTYELVGDSGSWRLQTLLPDFK